ncbi:PA2169 family four-helix-bundle protein [Algibacter sp. Ld11]|uniref:ferritin-like domain-containing protein n=1 Tax=Algibacter sp. Ld11 TaxID=649150 RepID=UPI00386D27FA
MSTYTETIGNKLNEILEKTYDAEKGYAKAAENTDHSLLKPYFKKRSKERYNFGHDLKAEILKFGEEPEKGGSVTGTVHRAWMDTKALFSANDAESMLEESIRGEKAAVAEYEDALKDTALPLSTATLLSNQMQSIKSDLNTIKFLEDLS